MQERVGVGRALWWIRQTSEIELNWIERLGGMVLIDFVFAAAGFSIAKLLYLPFDSNFIALMSSREEEVDLLQDSEEGQINETTQATSERSPLLVPHPRRLISQSFLTVASTRPKHLSKPILILSFLLFLQLVCPLFTYPSSPLAHSHPSPVDSDFTYPPVSVGCVALPRYAEGDKLDNLLKETKRVASRGVKVISWEESAVRLQGGRKGRGEEEGWDGMGSEEKRLLREVAEISEMYKVR